MFAVFAKLFIKAWVESVEILGIHAVLSETDSVAKPLIMHKLAFAQEFERLAHVRVVNHSQKVVVGHARLLLC